MTVHRLPPRLRTVEQPCDTEAHDPCAVDLTKLSDADLLTRARQFHSIWMRLECNGAQYSTPDGASEARAARHEWLDARAELRRREEARQRRPVK